MTEVKKNGNIWKVLFHIAWPLVVTLAFWILNSQASGSNKLERRVDGVDERLRVVENASVVNTALLQELNRKVDRLLEEDGR